MTQEDVSLVSQWSIVLNKVVLGPKMFCKITFIVIHASVVFCITKPINTIVFSILASFL